MRWERILNYCTTTRDPLLPNLWGKVDDRENHYRDKRANCTLL